RTAHEPSDGPVVKRPTRFAPFNSSPRYAEGEGDGPDLSSVPDRPARAGPVRGGVVHRIARALGEHGWLRLRRVRAFSPRADGEGHGVKLPRVQLVRCGRGKGRGCSH